MKWVHYFVVGLFILVVAINICQFLYLFRQGTCLPIISLELATKAETQSILTDWYNTPVGNTNLLHYGRMNTYLDFLFILSYIGILVMISYQLMQKEVNIFLNNLLRLTLLLAFLAGLFDILENCILLWDFAGFKPGKEVCSSKFVSTVKWMLLDFILIVWVISRAKWVFTKSK